MSVSRTDVRAGGLGCFVRELPLLTVEVPGVWHVCGTADPLLSAVSGNLCPPLQRHVRDTDCDE